MGQLLKAFAVVTCAFVTSISVASPSEIERPLALDGSQYTVIAPVYDGSGGVQSYIRLYNGGTAASTFSVTVLNTTNGLTLGAASIQVPANASIQYPLTSSGGSNSIFAQAGVGASGGSYALYIQNSNTLAGYQHVTYNGGTTLFENNSVCTTPINQQFASSNKQVLTNVHTTRLSGYPSNIAIHNYASTATTVTLAAYDSATGSAAGQINQTISGNSTLTLGDFQLEGLVGFSPTSSQSHINVVVTNAAGGSLPVRTTQTIRNSSLGGDINMGESCAINAVPPTVVQVAPSVPTAYCGTISFPLSAPYYGAVTYLIAAVAPNGGIQISYFGTYPGGAVVNSVAGTVTGTSFTTTDGLNGTIQNGSLIGTFPGQYGVDSINASTIGCNSPRRTP